MDRKIQQQEEQRKWREDEEVSRALLNKMQWACPHLDQHGNWAIRLQHNFPDRQPCGICMQCHALIYPKQWIIAGPNKPQLQHMHPKYPVVMLMDERDNDLALLEEQHIKIVDTFLTAGHGTVEVFDKIETEYQEERNRIMTIFENKSEMYKQAQLEAGKVLGAFSGSTEQS